MIFDKITSINADYQNQKTQKQAFPPNEAHYRLLVENMNEDLIMTNEKGVITYINNKFLKIHDELGQLLTALKIDLFWLSSKLPKNHKYQKLLLEKTKSKITVKALQTTRFAPLTHWGQVSYVCDNAYKQSVAYMFINPWSGISIINSIFTTKK